MKDKFEIYLNLLEFYIQSHNTYKSIKYLQKIKIYYNINLKNNLKLSSINEDEDESFNPNIFIKSNIDDIQEYIIENNNFSNTSADNINFR